MTNTRSFCLALSLCLVPGTLGQFQLSFGTQGPPAPTFAPLGQIDPNCRDAIDDCSRYGKDSCIGQYATWAKNNCPLYCGFCTGVPTTPPPCVDVLDNCAGYEQGACTSADYAAWAQANCRRTCRLCPAAVLAQLDSLTTTIPPSQCVDKVDCRLYTKTACNGSFEMWAKDNCPNYCGFCQGVQTSKPCLDSRPNCAQFEKDMCTNPTYKIWVDDNCAQYCGRCGAGGSAGGSGGSAPVPIRPAGGSPGQPTPPPIGPGYNTPPPLPGRR